MVQVTRWLALVAFAPALITTAAAQRLPSRVLRGVLTFPFENCRTSAGSARIGATPEFNHDPARNPLLGKRENVVCMGRHTKKTIFTDMSKHWNVNIYATIGELV